MNAKLSVLVLTLFSLGACAQAPAVTSSAAKAAADPAKTARPSALTGQVLYQFLLAEIASQRGDRKLAADAYADLARKTRDVRVARRAAELAIYANNLPQAVDMARLWTALEPKSSEARQLLISSLVRLDRLAETKPQFEAMLAMGGPSVGEVFLQLHGLLARSKNKSAALSLVKELAAAYPSVPEAHMAVAQGEIAVGQNDRALVELDAALRLSPGLENAALLKGQALSSLGDGQPMAYWKTFLAEHPEASRVRLLYARGLTKASRFEEAKGEFETLVKNAPQSAELHLTVGLLAMQMNDLDGAEQQFSQALALGYPDEGLIQMYLGQVAEVRQRYDLALDWYRKVTAGQYVLQARLKMALALAKQKKVDEAMASLEQLDVSGEADANKVAQTKAQILREGGRYRQAIDVLSLALAKTPDAGELLYDRAMIEEKVDQLAEMEADLRHVIELQPDSAQAYNALGYTLVDRTARVEEGIVLLEKALKLSPDDPFILDSMGWAQYRAGRLADAADLLRRAYSGRADPEIAAHLGEVLWQKGAKDEAKQVWQAAAKADPDNDLLRKTLSRFGQ